MTSERLEALSDGVLAIIVTIMVLELNPPDTYDAKALTEVLPTFISYVVSFIYVSVYWVGHHHLFKLTEKINEGILWGNLQLLFFLSLIPFATAWIDDGSSHRDLVPVLLYGFILLMCKISYLMLRVAVAKCHGEDSEVGRIVRRNSKDYEILSLYVVGIALAFVDTYIAIGVFFLVGVIKVLYLRRFVKKV
jgi:uncharacterized membrane protein